MYAASGNSQSTVFQKASSSEAAFCDSPPAHLVLEAEHPYETLSTYSSLPPWHSAHTLYLLRAISLRAMKASEAFRLPAQSATRNIAPLIVALLLSPRVFVPSPTADSSVPWRADISGEVIDRFSLSTHKPAIRCGGTFLAKPNPTLHVTHSGISSPSPSLLRQNANQIHTMYSPRSVALPHSAEGPAPLMRLGGS